MRSVLGALVPLLALIAPECLAMTGIDFLLESQPPVFRERHGMLPLTRWAWPLNYEMNVELARRWGYALEVDLGRTGETLDQPASVAARTVAYIRENPGQHPVSVNTRRVMFEWDTVRGLLSADAWCRDASGALVMRDSHPVLKPYISDADAAAIGGAEVARLQRLRALGIHATVVLNGAEYMPGVPGNEAAFWQQDPAVKRWMDSLASGPAAERIAAYASSKAREEQSVRDAVLSVMPQSAVVYYVTGDVRRGMAPEDVRLTWAYPYRYLIRGSTVPSWELYFGYFGSWLPAGTPSDGLVLHATNGVAQGIAGGQPLGYNWLSAGWALDASGRVSDDRRYMGFLKFLYTLGSIGNVAGYFTYPPGGFNDELGATPPDWLRQVMLLSHAHATFTHLEHYLRDGDLLPGDGLHAYSADMNGRPTWPHPSYEFAAHEAGPGVHVAARKLRSADDWLVVAWVAAGPDRRVTVSVPGLGLLALHARAEGSLYRVTPGPALTLLDTVGMDPSRTVADLLGNAPVSTARPDLP